MLSKGTTLKDNKKRQNNVLNKGNFKTSMKCSKYLPSNNRIIKELSLPPVQPQLSLNTQPGVARVHLQSTIDQHSRPKANRLRTNRMPRSFLLISAATWWRNTLQITSGNGCIIIESSIDVGRRCDTVMIFSPFNIITTEKPSNTRSVTRRQ